MLIDLLQQILKCTLHGSRRVGAEVCTAICPEGNRKFSDTLVPSRRRCFFHHSLEVDEFGTEHLQTFLQFFDLVLNIFFDGGNFMKTVTDVNVHERLGLANEVAQPSAFLSAIVHPVEKRQAENSTIFK